MQVVSSISWTHVASKTHGHFTLRVCCWNIRLHNLECSPHPSLLPEPAPHTLSFDMPDTLISHGFRSGEREGLKPPAWLLSPNTHSAIWIVYCVSSCTILVRKRIVCLVIGEMFKPFYQNLCSIIDVGLYGRRKVGPIIVVCTYGSLNTNYKVMLVRGITLDFLRYK